MRHRICPDILERDPMFKVINGYTNEDFRQSFSLELWKCNSKYGGKKCRSDSEIRSFLKSVFFTIFAINSEVVFTEDAEVLVTAKDRFLFQFQADLEKYIDNNNFVRLNSVLSQNERFRIWKEPQHTRFIDLTSAVSWSGSAFIDTYNWKRDGVNLRQEDHQLLFGTYFFLADEVVEYQHSVMHIFDCLSSVGGLESVIFSLALNLVLLVNRNAIIAKLIRSLYFTEPEPA